MGENTDLYLFNSKSPSRYLMRFLCCHKFTFFFFFFNKLIGKAEAKPVL